MRWRLRALDVGQLIFGRGENHGDRLDLGDRDDPGLGRGVDDIADIDLAQADHAGDRRLDVGIVELGLGVVDRGSSAAIWAVNCDTLERCVSSC